MKKNTFPAWAGQPPVIPKGKVKATIPADVVVVGSGNAGVMAAVSAAFAGATVSVLEQQGKRGFGMYGLVDIGTINSQWALSRGVPYIDETEFLAEWQHRCQNRSDPRLIRQFAYESGKMLDWLLSMLPEEYGREANLYNWPAPKSTFTGEVSGFRSWVGTCELRGWNKAVRSVIAQAEAHGATWYWKNKAVVLEQEAPAGRVTGVIAQDENGDYVRYTARKGVILAAGDFGANTAMYTALYQEIVQQWESYGLDTSRLRCKMGRNGDGQRLAVWAGGSMEPGPYACVSPTAMPTMGDDPNLARWGGLFCGTSFLRLDGEGRRYSDEGILGVYGLLHRTIRRGPGDYYIIFDSKWPEYLQTQPNEHFLTGKTEDNIRFLESILQEVRQKGAEGFGTVMMGPPGSPTREGTPFVWAADSLEELAERLGFEGARREVFLAELERYNENCRRGKDLDFAKDPRLLMAIDTPPFYGMKNQIQRPDTGLVTLNGVITDENQAVLDKAFKPIPGLFATGTNGGGKFYMQYVSVLAGIAAGTAMTFGMLAGRHVAGLDS